MSERMSDVTIVPVGPFDVEGAPTSIDARCARFGWKPSPNAAIATDAPVCCARGALIDGRARLEIARRANLRWSGEWPSQLDAAPSGIVERLGDVEVIVDGQTFTACAALEDARGGVRGDACALRRLAREAGLREDAWLLDGCALFPLDMKEGELIPSPRIDESLFVEATGAPSLWDEARARVAIRFGQDVAAAIDAAVQELRARRSHALHLKTLK